MIKFKRFAAAAAAVILAAATVSCEADKGGEQTDKLDKATRENLRTRR